LAETISERLQQKGVKPTPQRLQIARVILAEPCHLSADKVIASLRAAGSQVSKATVYNTLNLFCRQGILREIAVDPSRKFYDSTTSPHHHFYNEDTGELIDIDPDQLQIGSLPGLPQGTVEQSRELVVRIRNRSR
jgi:Fur family iron response transcriptional regulator